MLFSSGVSINNAPWLNDARTFCVDGTTESENKFYAALVANLDTTHDQIPVKTAIPNEYLHDCSATSFTLRLLRI